MFRIHSTAFMPFDQVWQTLFQSLDEMTGESSRRTMGSTALDYDPMCEVYETKDAYQLEIDVPGLRREDLDIEVTGRCLSIAGERKVERSGSSTSRRICKKFLLPEGVDATNVNADLSDGVLRLMVRKPDAEKSVKIAIGSGERKTGFLKDLIGAKSAKNHQEHLKVNTPRVTEPAQLTAH